MWIKSVSLLMVRIKVLKHRAFTFPVPVWVVDEFLVALKELAGFGELVLRRVPLPQEEKARKHMGWVNLISPSDIIDTTQSFIKDLYRYKGLDVVDVEAAGVQVKISIK